MGKEVKVKKTQSVISSSLNDKSMMKNHAPPFIHLLQIEGRKAHPDK